VFSLLGRDAVNREFSRRIWGLLATMWRDIWVLNR